MVLDNELNFPSYYSTVSLLFCSSLLAVIAFAKRKNNERYLYWFVPAVIFLFLSMDESIGIHESLKSKVQLALNTSGSFYSAVISLLFNTLGFSPSGRMGFSVYLCLKGLVFLGVYLLCIFIVKYFDEYDINVLLSTIKMPLGKLWFIKNNKQIE